MALRKCMLIPLILFLILASLVVIADHEKSIQVINDDRCLNIKIATEAYEEFAANYDLNIRTYEFALKGLKAKGAEEGTIKAIELLLHDTRLARDFLENEYQQYVKDNEPLRSWIPPFKKECPAWEE